MYIYAFVCGVDEGVEYSRPEHQILRSMSPYRILHPDQSSWKCMFLSYVFHGSSVYTSFESLSLVRVNISKSYTTVFHGVKVQVLLDKRSFWRRINIVSKACTWSIYGSLSKAIHAVRGQLDKH